MESRHDLFITLTYRRDRTKNQILRDLTNDINRFTRRLRKNFGSFEYLRALETHKDNFPHLHFHIIFRDFNYAPENFRYIPERYYARLKSTWDLGHSDIQAPRGKGYGVVRYTLKYLNKTTSSNRLWSQLLSQNASDVENTSNTTSEQQESAVNVPSNTTDTPIIRESPFLIFIQRPATTENLISCPILYRKKKKITWTRGYVEILKNLCENRALS